jgi:hypothetical protein
MDLFDFAPPGDGIPDFGLSSTYPPDAKPFDAQVKGMTHKK